MPVRPRGYDEATPPTHSANALSPGKCATLKHMLDEVAEVGIRALKQNASAVVAKAAGGTTVTITDHGRPVARLVPIPASELEGLIAAGRGRPARRRISDLAPPRPGPDLSGTLREQREAERY